MHVVIYKSTDSCEDYHWMRMEIDGKVVLEVTDMNETPEDAILLRDLSFVFDIPKWLALAYDAGKWGEGITITKVEEA